MRTKDLETKTIKNNRPEYSDYTYFKKYGIRDYRGGGRQSARETACRVLLSRGKDCFKKNYWS